MKTLNKLTFILVLMMGFYPKNLSAQSTTLKTDSAHTLLDTVLSFAKHNSLYRKSVNWVSVEDSVRKSAASAVTVKDVLPSVQLLYKLLGDHHGFITYGPKNYGWAGKQTAMDPATHRALIKKGQENNVVNSCILEKGYGYLLLPPNNPTHHGDVGRIAQQIQDTLLKLEPEKLKGLIIDLRVNFGGDMWAMLSGLSNLFDPGKLGSFQYPVTGKSEEWGIKNNKIYSGADSTNTPLRIGKKRYNLKVVVLIGPYTRSSGEATAISFKGRKNTFFIGENSGGYTTSNESFQFTKDIGVFVASSVEADRNGNLYLDYVKPDVEIIGQDNFDRLTNDAKVIAGLKWLKGK